MDTYFFDEDMFFDEHNELYPLPSNSIICKNLTGLGATTAEIKYPRNSIIIEPNVPVIINKRQKFSQVQPVIRGVNKRMIKSYLLNSKFKYKKFITTPESFIKIIQSLNELSIDYKSNYFLLF